MSVKLPSQNGVIFLRSGKTLPVITRMRQRNARFPRNEDQKLAAFWVAGNPTAVARFVDSLMTEGLQRGVDFVLTGSSDGVYGEMPEWLQEDEPGGTFSVPGTGGPPRAEPRLTYEQSRAKATRQSRVERVAALRAADEAAYRQWPELRNGDLVRFLGDCWALVEFVEGSRLGGPARTWVRERFPQMRWHVPVLGGYQDELQTLLKAYYKAPADPSALVRLRRRAGQYVGALHTGTARGTVDVFAFNAWQMQFSAPEDD